MKLELDEKYLFWMVLVYYIAWVVTELGTYFYWAVF